MHYIISIQNISSSSLTQIIPSILLLLLPISLTVLIICTVLHICSQSCLHRLPACCTFFPQTESQHTSQICGDCMQERVELRTGHRYQHLFKLSPSNYSYDVIEQFRIGPMVNPDIYSNSFKSKTPFFNTLLSFYILWLYLNLEFMIFLIYISEQKN